jgi:hypothetical protein
VNPVGREDFHLGTCDSSQQDCQRQSGKAHFLTYRVFRRSSPGNDLFYSRLAARFGR